jgi:hypothetical protein
MLSKNRIESKQLQHGEKDHSGLINTVARAKENPLAVEGFFGRICFCG